MFLAGCCLLSGGPASLDPGWLCHGAGRYFSALGWLDILHPWELPLLLLLFPWRLARPDVPPARRHGLRLHNALHGLTSFSKTVLLDRCCSEAMINRGNILTTLNGSKFILAGGDWESHCCHVVECYSEELESHFICHITFSCCLLFQTFTGARTSVPKSPFYRYLSNMFAIRVRMWNDIFFSDPH